MIKKNFRSRPWFEVTRRDGRVRLGAILFLSALGLALLAIVMCASLMAAPVDVAPTWGKVLIAGGFDDLYGTLSSTDLYDPTTNSFAVPADTATMNTAREFATATLLPSGKVLIAGGSGDASTDLYDAATNSFAAPADTATMNTARTEATATLLPSGKVLIAGGFNFPSYLSSTELYDPATNSFAAPADTATMNTAREFATATLLASGKVLIAGGCCDTGGYPLSSTELYDPATNSFAAPADTATMNTAREFATATLLASGKVLVAGGCCDTTGLSLSSTELYDPATNSFAAPADTATMNTAREFATATLLPSGKVLIAGGPARFNHSLSSTELYRPATNSFARTAKTATMNQPRESATATLLSSGKVLIAGGAIGKASLDTTDLYDPTTNSFAVFADTARMNSVRAEAVAVLLPNALTPGLATLLPPSLDFGTVVAGQSSAPSAVTLTNGTAKNIKIRGTAIGRDFKVVSTTCSLTLNALQSCGYSISFAPLRAGTKNEVFRVTVSAGGRQKVKLHGVATRH